MLWDILWCIEREGRIHQQFGMGMADLPPNCGNVNRGSGDSPLDFGTEHSFQTTTGTVFTVQTQQWIYIWRDKRAQMFVEHHSVQTYPNIIKVFTKLRQLCNPTAGSKVPGFQFCSSAPVLGSCKNRTPRPRVWSPAVTAVGNKSNCDVFWSRRVA